VYWSSCKVPLFCSDFNGLEISLHNFEKYLNKKFYEKPSRRSQFVPYGRTDGRTDVTKVTVAFRNFANAPKNQSVNVVWGNIALYSEILAKHLDRVHELKEGYLNNKLVVHKVTTALYSKVITQ